MMLRPKLNLPMSRPKILNLPSPSMSILRRRLQTNKRNKMAMETNRCMGMMRM
jgi:hypothetical protein